jgi:hypothetical protein
MDEDRSTLTVEQLEADSRKLQRLISDAQRMDRAIADQLQKMREHGRATPPDGRA